MHSPDVGQLNEHCGSAQAVCHNPFGKDRVVCCVCRELLVLIALLPPTTALHPQPDPVLSSESNGVCWLTELWSPKGRMAAFGVQVMWFADVCGYVGNNCLLCFVALVGLIYYKLNNFTVVSVGDVPWKFLWPLVNLNPAPFLKETVTISLND